MHLARCGAIKLQAILMIRLEIMEVILRWMVGGGLKSDSKFFIQASMQVKMG